MVNLDLFSRPVKASIVYSYRLHGDGMPFPSFDVLLHHIGVHTKVYKGIWTLTISQAMRYAALTPYTHIFLCFQRSKQVKGIEPSSSGWKPDILTVIRYLHLDASRSKISSASSSAKADLGREVPFLSPIKFLMYSQTYLRLRSPRGDLNSSFPAWEAGVLTVRRRGDIRVPDGTWTRNRRSHKPLDYQIVLLTQHPVRDLNSYLHLERVLSSPVRRTGLDFLKRKS